MPNWVTNTLTIEGENAEKIMQELLNEEQQLDFNKIVPTPESIFQGDLGEAERKEHGSFNWYDWNCKNWGTKWNASESDIVDYDRIRFSTAWSMPEPVYKALSKKYPDNQFFVTWYDEDYGSNLGKATFIKGQATAVTQPESGSDLAYELLFELNPNARENFEYKDGGYIWKEE